MTKYTPEVIKNRLSNIGEAIGTITLEYIVELEKENQQLREKNKILEAKNFEKCPFRYSDMGCDYCDWKDRDLKEEYEKELQEEMQQHEQRMFDLQCQNYDFDYGDVKY
jgi:choline kinase